MRSDRVITMCVASVLLMCCCIGCERARIKDSAVDQFPRSTEELDFLDALEKQMVVTNDDALHGLIVLQMERTSPVPMKAAWLLRARSSG